ncbi:MAG: hypothetical protein ACRCYX_15535 [Dermatophilaceae bacterium]
MSPTYVEIRRQRGVVLDRFESDVDPTDQDECIALLRRRARQLRRNASDLSIYVHEGRVKKTYKV